MTIIHTCAPQRGTHGYIQQILSNMTGGTDGYNHRSRRFPHPAHNNARMLWTEKQAANTDPKGHKRNVRLD